ncbi:MAG: EamA family transporter [Bacteroidetes bacterium]|nr:EamA family transporter [Bacteroidota bacterium]
MEWLIGSIFSSAVLFLLFKSFGRWNIQIFPAIVVNYITCFICGNLLLQSRNIFALNLYENAWFWQIGSLGILFIFTFYLMGLSTRNAGAGATSVASKMSVMIPAAVSILFLREQPGISLIAGMILSLLSVYLMSPETAEEHKNHRGLFLLILVFLGSGGVDTGLNLLKYHLGSTVDDYTISTIVFGIAAVIGICVSVLRYHTLHFGLKELGGGMVLGLVNFFSLVAMFRSLGIYHGNTSWFFAINNIGVVTASTIISILVFREKIDKKGWLGLAVSGIALLLMNFHAFF